MTSKPTEVRMGKGKGSVDFWAAKVKPGRIMFEIDGVSEGRCDGGPAPCRDETAAENTAWWSARTGKGAANGLSHAAHRH